MTEPIPPIEGETIDPDVPVVAGWSDAPVDGDRIDLSVSSIVAGTPGAARVEIAGDGLHAYDATGVETARIIGEEGVFVGGEFRTSDALPGQVTLSDTAALGKPGIAVEPEDPTGYDTLPSIGPEGAAMHIRGGVSTDGSLAGAAFQPTEMSLYHNGPGANGTGSWASIDGSDAALVYRPDRTTNAREAAAKVGSGRVNLYASDAGGFGGVSATQYGSWVAWRDSAEPTTSFTSSVAANAEGAELAYSPPGTTGRRQLVVDATGVWVKAGAKSYNLEETAQDSGWVTFTTVSGITANNTSWRNKGGVMWFRGFVTATWVSGWNLVRGGFVAGEIPTFGVERPAWNAAGVNYGVRMRATGDLEVYCPSAGSATIRLDGLNYPTT